VKVAKFDLPSLIADRDQLWAEAAAREAAGESIRLKESLYKDAADEQDARHREDPWQEIIFEKVIEPKADKDYILTTEIWEALKEYARSRNNNDADRIANIMQRLGYGRKQRLRRQNETKQLTYWVRDGVEVQGDL
jgi:predicted P-loop ATPase